MKRPRRIQKLILVLALVVLAGGALSCREEGAAPRAWIDFPEEGASLPLGRPVLIMSHAYAQEGVAEVILSVNGEIYRRDESPQPGASFLEVIQEWRPTAEGVYTLEVITYGRSRAASNPASVSVAVAETVVQLPTTPAITPTPTWTPITSDIITPTVILTPTLPITPTITATPTPTPTPTSTPTPTATPTTRAQPPENIRFWADHESIQAGNCTRVFWHVSDVTAYWVNGQAGIGDDGSFQTCPCKDETHNLRVVQRDGSEKNLSLTIKVSGQCGTPGPPSTQADIRFWADSESVQAGSCTRVSWHVSNVGAYWVNGQAGVGDDGSFQTCPCQDETHTLRVRLRDGTEQNLSVTIKVSGQCQ